ncbi:acetoacetate decarboxylase family protein [Jatrophihabitans fulvus]
MADYPPEPWTLAGQLHTSVFLVPLADLPLELPPGWTPVRLGSRAVVGTAWVTYEPPGIMTYGELMATVLVRKGLRTAVHIVRIWVDSESSRDGGRGLWAIPKDLASFSFRGDEQASWDEKGDIARGTVRSRVRLPGRLPVRFSIVQRRDGRALVSPVRSKAGAALGSATFEADPSGPLGFLAGRRPWLTLSLRDFAMIFGTADRVGTMDGDDRPH